MQNINGFTPSASMFVRLSGRPAARPAARQPARPPASQPASQRLSGFEAVNASGAVCGVTGPQFTVAGHGTNVYFLLSGVI